MMPYSRSHPPYNRYRLGFTLMEVVLAMAIAGLLAIVVFAMVTTSTQNADLLSREAIRESQEETLDRLLRTAFSNFPSYGQCVLTKSATGETYLALLNVSGGLGFTPDGELDGGWVLQGQPQADGTLMLSLKRLPPRTTPSNLNQVMEEAEWIPLMSGFASLHWQFRDATTQEWKDEWLQATNRPDLIALNWTFADHSAPLETFFWIPQVVAVEQAPRTNLPPQPQASPTPIPPKTPPTPTSHLDREQIQKLASSRT